MRSLSMFVGAGLLAFMFSGNVQGEEQASTARSLKVKTAVYQQSDPVPVQTVSRRHYRAYRGYSSPYYYNTYYSAPRSYYYRNPGYNASYYYGYPGYGSYYYGYPGYGVGYYPPYYYGGYYGGYGTFYNGVRLGW